MSNIFLKHTGIKYPVICGAMYPCSNPELVAAVSKAGGIGMIQPLSMVYVHGHEFRNGLKLIRSITQNPVGINIIVEKSVQIYQKRMLEYLDIALDEGIRFVVTALGNPRPVVERVKAKGGYVYHDVVDRHWAKKAISEGVDGLICVNNRAGGHAGKLSMQQLYDDLRDLNLPLICAGGISEEQGFKQALDIGYAGVQMGTRFIAASECNAHQDYKDAIVKAEEKDIVLTDKITGVSLAVINTPYIQKIGLKAGPIARWMLRGHKTKHWMRMIYALKSVWQLKQSLQKGSAYKDYFQAGKSVAGIHAVESAEDIVARFAKVYSSNSKSS